MVDVEALSEPDWDWLRGVLGDECVGGSERRYIAPVFGGPWLFAEAPAVFVPQLIAAGQTVEQYHRFTEAAWSDQHRCPSGGEGESPEGLFLIRWLLCSNFPLDDALAYALAYALGGVGPDEALETWEPLRQSDPERWAATSQFMSALLADPDAGSGAGSDA